MFMWRNMEVTAAFAATWRGKPAATATEIGSPKNGLSYR